jgi:hypothetical protein
MQCTGALPEYMNSPDMGICIPELVFCVKGVRKEMQRWKVYGLIAALVCGFIFAPVAACHDWKIEKTGLGDVCIGKETEFSYTITASVTDGRYQSVKIVDELPSGVEFVSASDGGTYVPGTPNKVKWNFVVDKNGVWSKSVTVTVKSTPAGAATITNVAKFYQGASTLQARTSFDTVPEICESVPEFPTMAIPAVALIGIVLVAGYLKRKDL